MDATFTYDYVPVDEQAIAERIQREWDGLWISADDAEEECEAALSSLKPLAETYGASRHCGELSHR